MKELAANANTHSESGYFSPSPEIGRAATPPPFQLEASTGEEAKPKVVEQPKTFSYSGFGGNVVCDPEKTTTLLGRFAGGTELISEQHPYKVWGPNNGGINLLNVQNWSMDLNMQWLDQAMTRKDNIRLISDPQADSSKFRYDKKTDTKEDYSVYYLELGELNQSGDYQLDSSTATYKTEKS